MTRCVALLRAINVGGNNKVSMGDLRDAVASLGFVDVSTILQTGNVLFDAKTPTPTMESALEGVITGRLDLTVDVIVRTAPEWRAVVEENPFREEAERSPAQLLVMPLKSAPAAAQLASLRDAIVGSERVELRERNLYVVYPDGMGRSKLTTALIERKLGTRGTGRNWNTVRKIAEALGV